MIAVSVGCALDRAFGKLLLKYCNIGPGKKWRQVVYVEASPQEEVQIGPCLSLQS